MFWLSETQNIRASTNEPRVVQIINARFFRHLNGSLLLLTLFSFPLHYQLVKSTRTTLNRLTADYRETSLNKYFEKNY